MSKYYKTKLNTSSKKVQEGLKAMAGTYRKIWNRAMDIQEFWLGLSRCIKLRYLKTAKLYELLIMDREKSFPFVKDMDGGMIKAVSLKANESFKRWFEAYPRKTEYRRPRYLSRKKDNMSFKTSGNVRIFYDYIEVPKLGKIKLYEKGYIPQGKKYTNITFSHDGNDWWISLEVLDPESTPPVNKDELQGEALIDFTRDGDIIIDGKILKSAVTGKAYQNAERKKRTLERKLKRQSLANIHYSEKSMKTRTSRNMMKTRKLIQKVQTRLKNARTDSFMKQACEVARTKLQKLHCLSSLTMRQRRQNGLSRKMREKHTLDFFNIICKRVEMAGAQVLQRDLTAVSCTP